MSVWRVLAGGALLVAAAGSFLPRVLWVARDGWIAVPALALMVVMAASAVLLLRVPAHRSDGWWIVAAIVSMGAAGLMLPELEAGYWHQLAFVTDFAAAACLVPPFLRYPLAAAPAPTVARLTLLSGAVLVGLPVAGSLFWAPSMAGYVGPARWITVYPWEDAALGLANLVPYALVAPVAWFTVVQWRRQRTVGGPGRIVVRFLAFLTTAMAWGLIARTAINQTGDPQLTQAAWVVHTGFTAAALLLVFAVALGITVRRAAFVEELVGAAGDPSAIEQVLRRHTADPSLRLLFLTDEGWTDAGGRAVVASGTPGRTRRTVVAEGGVPVVSVEVARGVDTDDRHTHALIDGAGFVLQSARLSVQQAAQSRELRESRRRIVEASVVQRRRLERDLHDGAQQHLLAAQAALSRAEMGGEPAAVGEAIRDARARLATTMEELRSLARGVHPALLSQAGLGAALTSLTGLSDRVHVEVAPELAGLRMAPVIEATAWFVASEAVVNALKHHDAPVEVRAGLAGTDGLAALAGSGDEANPRRGHVLECQVTDRGPGGAVLVAGGGLAGLRDRVLATGGSFDLLSPPGKGTTVRVHLPFDLLQAGTP